MRAVLKPGREGRVLSGHLWIYKGNIARVEGDPDPGDVIDVVTSRGRFLGRGYFNPHSQITVRLLTREPRPIDADFFTRRVQNALDWRRRFYPQARSYRVVYSEGDLLPGLIVDRYEDVLVVQFLTLGMDVRREELLQALNAVLQPTAVYERSDVSSRRLEGLEPRQGPLAGNLPPQPMTIRENDLRFLVDVASGQKTGYFFDQKENRRQLAKLVPGARVLDAFCHTGSFAVHALHYGADEVLAVDSSEAALEVAQKNAALNGYADRCRFEAANAFDLLREFDRSGRRFDCVILDPPAFAKGKSSVDAAQRGYKEINLRGLKILEPGGFLITCSCSHHISPKDFYQIVLNAAADAQRPLRLVEIRGQAKDHPVLPGVPETEYLKCLIVQAM